MGDLWIAHFRYEDIDRPHCGDVTVGIFESREMGMKEIEGWLNSGVAWERIFTDSQPSHSFEPVYFQQDNLPLARTTFVSVQRFILNETWSQRGARNDREHAEYQQARYMGENQQTASHSINMILDADDKR